MGTKFEEIYCLNNVIRKDTTIARLPIYQFYSLCYKQLMYSITAFMYDCLKDITKFVPYSEQEFIYISDGVQNEFEITETIVLENSNIYVGYLDEESNFYTEILDYTYDNVNNTIILPEPLAKDTRLMVAFYNIGEFDVELDIDEKTILSEGMNIPFLESYQNNERSLNQIIYSKSYSIHSQAEQLKQLSTISVSQWRDRVSAMITKYSYRKPKDGMKKLSGRYNGN